MESFRQFAKDLDETAARDEVVSDEPEEATAE